MAHHVNATGYSNFIVYDHPNCISPIFQRILACGICYPDDSGKVGTGSTKVICDGTNSTVPTTLIYSDPNCVKQVALQYWNTTETANCTSITNSSSGNSYTFEFVGSSSYPIKVKIDGVNSQYEYVTN